MVHLSRIYTRLGDEGLTDLADLSRVPKTDWRIEAVGTVAEANAALGLALTAAPRHPVIAARLQHELFNLGADLATPLPPEDDAARATPRIGAELVTRLENDCDQVNQDLAPLDSFVLPGGGEAAARLHLAATVLRRAERAAWQAAAVHGLDCPGGLNSLALAYLNRLSDLVFVLARASSQEEVRWDSGR